MAGEGWAIRMSSAGGFEARRGGNLRGGGQGSRQWRQRTKGEARRASGGWVGLTEGITWSKVLDSEATARAYLTVDFFLTYV